MMYEGENRQMPAAGTAGGSLRPPELEIFTHYRFVDPRWSIYLTFACWSPSAGTPSAAPANETEGLSSHLRTPPGRHDVHRPWSRGHLNRCRLAQSPERRTQTDTAALRASSPCDHITALAALCRPCRGSLANDSQPRRTSSSPPPSLTPLSPPPLPPPDSRPRCCPCHHLPRLARGCTASTLLTCDETNREQSQRHARAKPHTGSTT